MNLRDRITWQEEENKITFIVENDWVNADIGCGGRELAIFLANILDVARRILKDADFPEELENKIIATWKDNIKDFTKKRK